MKGYVSFKGIIVLDTPEIEPREFEFLSDKIVRGAAELDRGEIRLHQALPVGEKASWFHWGVIKIEFYLDIFH